MQTFLITISSVFFKLRVRIICNRKSLDRMTFKETWVKVASLIVRKGANILPSSFCSWLRRSGYSCEPSPHVSCFPFFMPKLGEDRGSRISMPSVFRTLITAHIITFHPKHKFFHCSSSFLLPTYPLLIIFASLDRPSHRDCPTCFLSRVIENS